jgi:uncharacterized membrane protein
VSGPAVAPPVAAPKPATAGPPRSAPPPAAAVAPPTPSAPLRALEYVRAHVRVSWAGLLILAAVVIETAVLVDLQALNYHAFFFSEGDIGNYNQAIWTTVHGQGFFYYTTNIPGGTRGDLFAVHFSPFLILLAPFYALAPGPIALVTLKQLAVGLAALPLYGIARVYFPGRVIPLTFSFLYLLSPLSMTIDWNSFDPEAFIPLTLVSALFFFATGRFWGFLVCWVLTLSIIESIPAVLALFAVGGLLGTLVLQPVTPWLTRVQERKYLVAALLSAVAWLGIAYVALQLASVNGGSFGNVYAARYTVLGASSFLDVIPRSLSDPSAARAALMFGASQKEMFVGILILASGVVSLLVGFRYLLPLAGYMVLALLSNSSPLYSIGTQYPAYISGFLFVGAVEGSLVIYSLLARRGRVDRRARLGEELARSSQRVLATLRGLAPDSQVRTAATAQLTAATAALAAGRYREAARRIRAARVLVRRARPIESDPMFDAALVPRLGTGGATAPPVPIESRARRAAIASAALVVPVFCVVIAMLVANPLLQNPVAGDSALAFGATSAQPGSAQLNSVIAYLPPRASVVTTGHVFASVSNRRDAYTPEVNGFYTGTTNYSYWVDEWVNRSSFVLLSYSIDRAEAVILRTEANLTGFGAYAADDGAFLDERGWTGPPAFFVPWTSVSSGSTLKPTVGNSVSHAETSSAGPSIYHPAGGKPGDQLWSGPGDLFVPPGVYQVTFAFKIAQPQPLNTTSSVEFKVSDQPAAVKQIPFAPSAIGQHYGVQIGPSKAAPVTLASGRYGANSSNLTAGSVTLPLVWNGTGYLSFLGFEESSTMSMYLLSVSAVEVSPLP